MGLSVGTKKEAKEERSTIFLTLMGGKGVVFCFMQLFRHIIWGCFFVPACGESFSGEKAENWARGATARSDGAV
jgi:hypothetical protein